MTEDAQDLVWLHQSELEGPMYLNDKVMVKLILEGKDLEERPSEIESLRKANYKQYHYSRKRRCVLKRTTDSAEVSADAKLKAGEYTEIAAAMRDDSFTGPQASGVGAVSGGNGGGGGGSGGKRGQKRGTAGEPTPNVTESLEQAELREATSRLSAKVYTCIKELNRLII